MTRSVRPLLVLLAGMSVACSESPVQPVVDDPDLWRGGASGTVATAEALQAALDEAAASPGPSTIRLRENIVLASTLEYDGAASLTLDGRGHTIAGPADLDAFRANGGGDLAFRRLRLEGAPGGTGLHGIRVEVPADASGRFRIELDQVELVGFGLAGMWVDDQVGNSPASVDLVVRGSVIEGNGFRSAASTALADIEAVLDFDGIRANEGGPGDLSVTILNSRFVGNAADGFEGDEKGPGDAVSVVRNSDFDANGSQPQDVRSCAAYPELESRPAPCDDYPDLEDGFDIDEDGEGSIFATLTRVSARNNIDEGIDLDELGGGDLRLVARRVVATGNKDENIKATESDPEVDELEGVVRDRGGDVVVDLLNVTADGSLESRGARFEEFGPGEVRARIVASTFSGNTEDDGLRVDEADAGSVRLSLRRVEGSGNDGQGLQVTENGEGDIVAGVITSRFVANDNTAVAVEEADAGDVLLKVLASELIGASGEESLEVEEEDAGAGLVWILGGDVSPDPVLSDDVALRGRS